MLNLDASVRAAGRYGHAAVAGCGIDGKFKNDGMMVGWPAFQHFGRVAAQSLRQTPVKPQRNDIAGIVCRFPRPDVPEAGQACWPDRVEIADNCRRGLEQPSDVQELPAIEKLSMRQMHVHEADAAKIDDLRDTGRHAPGQGRCGQPQDSGPRQRVWAPDCQAIDAPLHGRAKVMPARQLGQTVHLFGGLLQKQQVGPVLPHQSHHIGEIRAYLAQQIPARHPYQRGSGVTSGKPRMSRLRISVRGHNRESWQTPPQAGMDFNVGEGREIQANRQGRQ